MARKILFLDDCQSEVLVLTSGRLLAQWPKELIDSLSACVRRGLRVRALVENRSFGRQEQLASLQAAGVEVREAQKKFSWMFRATPVQGEIWIFDRSELITRNERVSAPGAQRSSSMAVEIWMPEEAARGTASYFDQRWNASPRAQAPEFSVRHKGYAFHSGQQAQDEFFSCVLAAQKKITLCLPGGRVSRNVANALFAALRKGIQVTIFANAESDDSSSLRRLRRLAVAGTVVKICGRRLQSECAIVDSASVYMGSLPSSPKPWIRGICPVYVVQSPEASEEILAALENQVSVEINGEPTSSFYAYR